MNEADRLELEKKKDCPVCEELGTVTLQILEASEDDPEFRFYRCGKCGTRYGENEVDQGWIF